MVPGSTSSCFDEKMVCIDWSDWIGYIMPKLTSNAEGIGVCDLSCVYKPEGE